MEEIKELNDRELEKTEGGSHLEMEELEALEYGEILIHEDAFGRDLAKVKYLGEYRDPGFLKYMEVKVEILEIFNDDGYLRETTYGYMRVGDIVWISRGDLNLVSKA